MGGKKKRKSLFKRIKVRLRPVRYAITKPLLHTLVTVISHLPYGVALGLGRWVGRLCWLVMKDYRKLADRQWAACGFKESDIPGGGSPSRAVFENLGQNAVEWLHSTRWSLEKLRQHVSMEGLDFYQQAHAAGRGVIIVSAHLGSWELSLRTFHAYIHRTAAVVMANAGNDALIEWLIEQRKAEGHVVLTANTAVISMVRFLKRGGSIALMGDQDSTRSRGVFVNFFGRPAYTPTGAALLAHRTGAPLIVMTIHRDPARPSHHVATFGAPLWADLEATEEDEALRLTQALTVEIEARVCQHPTQWVWVHDRWRHQPGDKIRVRSAEQAGRAAARQPSTR